MIESMPDDMNSKLVQFHTYTVPSHYVKRFDHIGSLIGVAIVPNATRVHAPTVSAKTGGSRVGAPELVILARW